MGEDRGGNGLDPVMAVALGPSFGLLLGVALGVTVMDDIGRGIGLGTGIGLMGGTVIYALLAGSEDP